jgi:hypothetical protein
MVLMLSVGTFIKTGNPHSFKCGVILNQNYSRKRFEVLTMFGSIANSERKMSDKISVIVKYHCSILLTGFSFGSSNHLK